MAPKAKSRKSENLHRGEESQAQVENLAAEGGNEPSTALEKNENQQEQKSVDMGDNNLKLEASSPGAWGNSLSIKIDHDGIDKEVAKRYGLAEGDLFNITVFSDGSQKEMIRNVSFKEGSRRVDRVLAQESQLIRVQEGGLPSPRPAATAEAKPLAGGEDSKDLDPNTYLGVQDSGDKTGKSGIYALDKADIFNLLCIPPDSRNGDTHSSVYQAAMSYCVKRRAMLIVDPKAEWGKEKSIDTAKAQEWLKQMGLSGQDSRNAALYFPRVIESDPMLEGQPDTFVPCGIVAGVMARTDRTRGIWKAPAGLDASLNGTQGLQMSLTDDENGLLNPLGINCLRSFPVSGRIIWGARTIRGADQLSDEYKYIPVRRLTMFIEESLYRGTQWAVFEPNDEPLWAQIRLNVGSFMHSLFRQGAFQGKSPNEAYFVKCDKETTNQDDINKGIVNIIVGFSALKPAEFIVIRIQQIAGQIQT